MYLPTQAHIFDSGNKLSLTLQCDDLRLEYREKRTLDTGRAEWFTHNPEYFHPSQQELAEAAYSYRLSQDERHAFRSTGIGQSLADVYIRDHALQYDNIIPWVAPSINAVKYVDFIVSVDDNVGRKFFTLFEEDLKRTTQSNKGILGCFYNYLVTRLEKEDSRHDLMQTVWTFFNFT